MRQAHIYLAIKESKEEYGYPVELSCGLFGDGFAKQIFSAEEILKQKSFRPAIAGRKFTVCAR